MKVSKVVDALVAKTHSDRHNNANLGYNIMEVCVGIAVDQLPKKKIKKVGKFKIGSLFIVQGMSAQYIYKITKFYTENSVVGVAENEFRESSGYYPEVILPLHLINKAKKIKLKPVKIKKGEYFTIKTVNTVYKATRIDGDYVEGFNKLKLFKNQRSIRVARTGIVLSNKQAYKQQHKAKEEHIKKEKLL